MQKRKSPRILNRKKNGRSQVVAVMGNSLSLGLGATEVLVWSRSEL